MAEFQTGELQESQIPRLLVRLLVLTYLIRKFLIRLTYTLSFQRQFLRDWSLELRYLGTRGVHLLTQNRMNIQKKVTEQRSLPTFSSRPTQAQLDALPLTLNQIDAASNVLPQYFAAGFRAPVIGFLSNGNSSYTVSRRSSTAVLRTDSS